MAHYDVAITDADRIAKLASVLEHEISNAGDVPDPVRKAAEWLIADVRHLLTNDKGAAPSWALMATELLGYKDEPAPEEVIHISTGSDERTPET